MSVSKTKKQITFNVALSEEADFLVDSFIFLISKLEKFLFFEIKEEALVNFSRQIFGGKYFKNRSFWKKIEGNFHFSETLTEEAKLFLAGIFAVAAVLWIGNGDIVLVAHSEQDAEITNARVKESLDIEEAASLKLDAETPDEYSAKSQDEQCAEDKEQKKSSELCGKDDEGELKKIAEEIRKEKERTARAASYSAAQPVIRSARLPADFKVVAGRRVCGKSNDHPGKSNKGKGKHMDMECCLDPDEYPNPNCHYSLEKYGKYL